MAKINLRYGHLIGIKGKFAERKLRFERAWRIIYTELHDVPLTFRIAEVYLDKRCVPVMSDPFSDNWHLIVKEKNVPLFILDLVDCGLLEKMYAGSILWP